MCIQFFEGQGYSDDFVCKMSEIIEMLDSENPNVTLTKGCDIICAACPNNAKGCLCEHKVQSIDRRCLGELNLKFGDTVRWSKLKSLARDNIIIKDKLGVVCEDCQWSDICRYR